MTVAAPRYLLPSAQGIERALEAVECASVLVCGARAFTVARRTMQTYDIRAKTGQRGVEPGLRLVEVVDWDQDRWELF